MDDTDRMTSVQKAHALLARLDELEPDTPQASAALLGLTVMRPQLLGMLPTDPDELDALLVKGALWALSLRSDTAEPLELAEPAAGRLEATT